MENATEGRIVFSREELLKFFAKAFNRARSYMSSPGTQYLSDEEWDFCFQQLEEEIYECLATSDINTLPQLEAYFRRMATEWSNDVFRCSWSRVLNYKP